MRTKKSTKIFKTQTSKTFKNNKMQEISKFTFSKSNDDNRTHPFSKKISPSNP